MKIHFIGIGGIGVSALAQYYLAKGHEVSGSDLVLSDLTEELAKKGAKIYQGNSETNVEKDIDVAIYSPAIRYNNPEFRKARDTGAKLLSYPEALSELTKEHFTIAVSGSHGKSTTTSMLALAMIKAGLNPTVIVGTKVKEFNNSNFRMGEGKYLVIEACEYDSSFLNYHPKAVIITNIDKEHLDYFKNFENVVKAFKEFALKLPKDGLLVLNADDKNSAKLKIEKSKPEFKVEKYSLKNKESAKIKKLLKVPGEHNISNALAILVITRFLGVDDKITFKSLSEFTGTWRRFETGLANIGKKKITVVSDYGHHPNEVVATLRAVREKFGKKAIWVVFQPHQHQRTYYLFNDFVKVLRNAKADRIIIADIYDVAGRETKHINSEISSEKLAKEIHKKHVEYIKTSQIENYVKENIKTGGVLVVMGAGDIYKLAENLRAGK